MIAKGRFPAGTVIKKLAVRCEEIEGEDKHIPQGIKVIISLDSNLDEAAKARVLAAAGKCPVKRMIMGDMKDKVTTVFE